MDPSVEQVDPKRGALLVPGWLAVESSGSVDRFVAQYRTAMDNYPEELVPDLHIVWNIR